MVYTKRIATNGVQEQRWTVKMATSTTRAQYENLERKIDEHMRHSSQADERMTRIEEKLDQLADAVVSIARAEEKIAVLIEDTRDIKLSLNNTYERLHSVEIAATKNSADLKTLNKFFWIIASATITVAVSAFAVADGIF